MKESVRFGFIYYIVSILVLMLSQYLFRLLTAEIFSYAIWLYIIYMLIGMLMFLVFGLLVDEFKLAPLGRLASYVLLCLFVLNSVPFFEDRRILTAEAIESVLNGRFEFGSVGLHVIALISLVVAFFIAFRKRRANH